MRLRMALLVLLCAASVQAVVPANDVYIPSVGKGQGSCVNDVCAQFDTTVWIFNPAKLPASVQLFFLLRDQPNPSPVPYTLQVNAGATAEVKNPVQTITGQPSGFGALRVVSTLPVVVTSRIFDSNVVTNRGTGSAGQYFAGIPAYLAIGLGQTSDLIGLSQDAPGSTGVERTNFGFVETTGNQVTVLATRYDSAGVSLASKSYTVGARQPLQINVLDIGGPTGTNQRVSLSVTGGSGKILPFASLLQNATGDPSTVDMSLYSVAGPVTASSLAGVWNGGWVNQTFGSSGSASLNISVNESTQLVTFTIDLNGNVFGGADPPPATFSAPLSPGGGAFSQATSFGTVTGILDVTGHIRGTITGTPSPSISRCDFFGAILARDLVIEYTVVFTDGSTAIGSLRFIKF